MKTLLKVLAVLAVLGAMGAGAGFWLTADLIETADGFLAASAREDFARAQSYLSRAARDETSEEKLAAFARQLGLDQYREANWGNRRVSGGQGSMVGEIQTRAGAKIPVSITFVKEDGDWRIYGIETSGSDVSDTAR
jgi:hypothetical protein